MKTKRLHSNMLESLDGFLTKQRTPKLVPYMYKEGLWTGSKRYVH